MFHLRENCIYACVHRLHPGGDGLHHHHHRAGQVHHVFTHYPGDEHHPRREYAESWRKMQELRAQIQAQLKLADTLKKLGEQAGEEKLGMWES